MKYYIIAGEASGDLHGSNLVKEILKLDPAADIRCWGGELMEEAGAKLIKHYRSLAFMGFIEVIKNLRTILKNLSFCKNDISAFNPDAIILVDYPGFNLRIAKWAKPAGYKVIYYISPQVWAWKENRVKEIKKFVDKMLVILPFEKEFYAKWEYPVEYIGHPLVNVVESFLDQQVKTNNPDKPIVALLPGSRKQEILKKLPVMLRVAADFPGYQFIVAMAPGIEESFYSTILTSYANVSSISGKTYHLLSKSKAALVTSGTATLETALFNVPQIVCYKGSTVSYEIAKRVIRVKYISLVNLIMDKEVVKELIQHHFTARNLEIELKKILFDEKVISTIKRDYALLKVKLAVQENASAKAAASIISFVRKPI
ncbi:MAG: lipid-A-disaccharide synthase [Chitinophagaceae bacterium]|jgi:lipid-A-disaccharide synthase|nr:lipid-A-disaccharide synthase [Chitinophagaceae bacterium]